VQGRVLRDVQGRVQGRVQSRVSRAASAEPRQQRRVSRAASAEPRQQSRVSRAASAEPRQQSRVSRAACSWTSAEPRSEPRAEPLDTPGIGGRGGEVQDQPRRAQQGAVLHRTDSLAWGQKLTHKPCVIMCSLIGELPHSELSCP
jgi:hypothetical protein